MSFSPVSSAPSVWRSASEMSVTHCDSVLPARTCVFRASPAPRSPRLCPPRRPSLSGPSSRPQASASPAVSAPAAQRSAAVEVPATTWSFWRQNVCCAFVELREGGGGEGEGEEEKAKEEKEQRRRRREENESRTRESGKEKGKDEVILGAKHLLVAGGGPSLRRGLDPRSGQGG